AVTAVAGLATVPVAIVLSRSAQFQDAVGTLFTETSRMLTSLLTGREDRLDPALSTFLAPDALRAMAAAYLPRSLLALYCGVLSFSWWAGQASASRSMWQGATRFHFAGFRLESFWLWPLIGALALVLADLFFSARSIDAWHAIGWQYGAWNIGLVMMFLYGIQGLAILRFLFEKHGLPRLLWLVLLIGLVILAASPRTGVFVAVVLPAFGVSENWIRYRVVAGREPNESQ
ncbi:MAG TPA: hypothetical protein VL354_03110, partial [Spirochaetia bacterium]|nr:hypothetical protein [Spirochaetia bacterium]